MTEKEKIIRIDLKSPPDFHSKLEDHAIELVEKTENKVLMNPLLIKIITEYYSSSERKEFVFRDEKDRELLGEDSKRFTIRVPKSLFLEIEKHQKRLKKKYVFNVPRNSLILAIVASELNLMEMVQQYL